MTGVQTCALPIFRPSAAFSPPAVAAPSAGVRDAKGEAVRRSLHSAPLLETTYCFSGREPEANEVQAGGLVSPHLPIQLPLQGGSRQGGERVAAEGGTGLLRWELTRGVPLLKLVSGVGKVGLFAVPGFEIGRASCRERVSSPV